MITIEDFAGVPPEVRGAYVAVGNFDGVHRGHAHLLERLRARADAVGSPALALTFDPPPVAVLRPEAAPAPLTWMERRVELMKAAGATGVGVFRTGPWLLGLTAREFFDRVILEQLGARGMVEGPTFGFGRDRGGDAQILGSWCEQAGLDFEIATPTDDAGGIISSSRIRKALAEGSAAEAARLLGRPHRIRGLVTHGAGRGAGIGVPTANLDGIDTLIPDDGVYAVRAYLPGESKPIAGACNIGPNPTFGEQIRKVEAHLIDFRGDIYGRSIELDILERLRGTRRFEGLDDLLGQIRTDIEKSREICMRTQFD
ncbi:riboflavin biosynthesis protein RibF [Tundrisphaera lichenicola]|uniref:riboflavin biosynthesis protein RibF n=1 Tax=Tundrisphaera lichenicola TaxID=2029860 RepID=UPI003EBE4951